MDKQINKGQVWRHRTHGFEYEVIEVLPTFEGAKVIVKGLTSGAMFEIEGGVLESGCEYVRG